jgi:hypothetical protein
MRALGTGGDAAGFDHVPEQTEIGQVEAHHGSKTAGSIPLTGRAPSFEFDEGKLREILIVRQVPAGHIRRRRSPNPGRRRIAARCDIG